MERDANQVDVRGHVALALLFESLRAGTAARVARAFRDPRDAIGKGPDALAAVRPLSAAELSALASFGRWADADAEIERAMALGAALVPLGDPRFPPALSTIPDPPALLYVRGELTPEDARAVSIVGSRHASRYGMGAARSFAKHLARAGVTIVSGLARGIDQAAHEGALEAEGRTIAVLGCGLAVDYPLASGPLRDRIAARGAVISEFPLDAEPLKHHFPIRNRIVSGLSLGVLVAEATQRSGSLITARAALDQGREVFALPGPVDASGSAGTLELLRQGARVVAKPSHLLEDLGLEEISPTTSNRATAPTPVGAPHVGPRRLSARETAARQMLAAIALTPVSFDSLVERTGLDATSAAAVLLDLELDGLVSRGADGHYTAHDPFRDR